MDRQITEIKAYLAEGKPKLAIDELSRLSQVGIPSDKKTLIASLARASGVPTTGLRVLSHVRELNGSSPPEEIIEYCACLIDLGAYDEAIRRLSGDKNIWPVSVNFHLGRAHLLLHNLELAHGCFEAVLHSQNLDSGLIKETRRYLGQIYRLTGRFEQAFEMIRGLTEFPYDQKITKIALDVFLHKKAEALEDLKRIQTELRRAANYVDLREIDYFLARANGNRSLQEKLFFGTSSDSLREEMSKNLEGETRFPDVYLYGQNLGSGPVRTFDLFQGVEIGRPEVKLKVGQVLHRMLLILTSDFYKNVSVAGLQEKLFPGEDFDLDTSPSRIHQIVRRFKRWIKASQIPAKLVEESSYYRLEFTGDYVFKKQKKYLRMDQEQPLYVRLELALPPTDFSLKEAARAFGLSTRFTRRLLERAMEAGWVHKRGIGRKTRYVFERKGRVLH